MTSDARGAGDAPGDAGSAPIPLLDLGPEIEAAWEDLRAAAERVLRSGRYIGGPEVETFEREAAAYLEADHAIALNSGTDALVIGLRALGVGPGDEVITTAFTFFASAESIGIIGAREVFVDIEPDGLNLDPGLLAEAVTDRTRAVIPVHLFGRPADIGPILEVADRHGLVVLEDCAQSFGARYGTGPHQGRRTGTVGAAGAYSFYPTKNLGGFGDGGLLATDDAAVAEAARVLRDHGARRRDQNEVLGYNSRLDAIQAALLRVKLGRVEEQNAGRRAAAARYRRLFEDVPGVVTPEPVEGHVFHQYTIRIPGGRRDDVRTALSAAGIESMVYYSVPCHRLPVYADRDLRLAVAERMAREVLSLPLWPAIGADVQRRVRDTIAVALA